MADLGEMMSQFSALMYKNMKLYQRSIIVTLLEIGFTVLNAMVIVSFDAESPKEMLAHDVALGKKDSLFLVPDIEAINISYSADLDPSFNSTSVKLLPSLEMLEENLHLGRMTWFFNRAINLIKFEMTGDQIPLDWNYKVVLFEEVPTNSIFGNSYNYSRIGLTYCQVVATKLCLNYWKQKLNLNLDTRIPIKTQPMPNIESKFFKFGMRLHYLDSVPWTFCLFTIVSTMVISNERIANIKSTLKKLGLGPLVYWGSWFCSRMAVGLLIATCVSLIALRQTEIGLVLHVYRPLVFPLFLLFAVNSFTFSALMACVVPSEIKVFSLVFVGYTYFACNYLSNFLLSGSHPHPRPLVGALVYSHGARLCFDAFFWKEMYYDTAKDTSQYDLEIVEGSVYMIVNSLLNCLIVVLIEVTSDDEKSLLQRIFKKHNSEVHDVSHTNFPPQNKKLFEDPPTDSTSGIVIRDLVKMYGADMVVSGINLEIYKNQITMLLGHNGAGKTTTISMILGLTSITHGKVTINGCDVTSDISAMKRTLGLCPQVDLFFPKLTVYEHLVFYSMMRKSTLKKTEAMELLNVLGIGDRANVYPRNLSGGEKRKVSIACAFVGNTQTIFLDEPSSGLDPSARQDLWKALKTWRSGRTILMTTHFMDEAENLSDRIAILENGAIKCCGTPAFLKKVYGLNYKLMIVKEENCVEMDVVNHVKANMKSATFQSSNRSEMAFTLPESLVSEYPKLLECLEENMAVLNIKSFGLSAASMEDVFFRSQVDVEEQNVTPPSSPILPGTPVDEDDASAVDKVTSQIPTVPSNVPVSAQEADVHVKFDSKEADLKRIIQLKKESFIEKLSLQFYALFVKRWILFKRRIISVVLTMLTNQFLIAFHVWQSYQVQPVPPLAFTTQGYKNMTVMMGAPEDPGAMKIYNSLKELLRPNFHVVEPDKSLSFEANLKEWGRVNSLEKYQHNLMMGFEIKPPPDFSVVHFQSSFVHSEAIGVDLLLNAHVRAFLGSEYSIQSGVYPHESFINDVLVQFRSLLMLIVGMIFVQTLLLCWQITERASGSKQLQILSGVPFSLCLSVDAIFDTLVLTGYAAVIWASLFTQKSAAYLSDRLVLLIFIQLLAFGSIIPFVYTFQIFFSTASIGCFVFIVYNYAIVFLYLIYSRLEILKIFTPNVMYMDKTTMVFLLYLGEDILKEMIEQAEFFTKYAMMCGLIMYLFEYLRILGVSFKNIPALHRLCRSSLGSQTNILSDDDVVSEQNRILKNSRELRDQVILRNVRHRYIAGRLAVTALEGTSLGISNNECFGLLGQNGAGKSTTFKILIGEIWSRYRSVLIDDLTFIINQLKIYTLIGYCPQSDYLHEELTVRESLSLYGRLRGYSGNNLKTVIDYMLKAVLLEPYADKQAKILSSGTKRKLSIAIAVMGNPKFLLLDEPTTGMDIVAKRAVWDLLKTMRSLGSTQILTSHSMEECETLCTRLTIMSKGRLLCLGSPQHLKTKYAQGFTITVHLKPESGFTVDDVIKHLKGIFPQAEVFSQMDLYLHLQVPAGIVPLSALFDKMETAKKDLDLEHYTIQQTTLEQVFLMFMHKTKA
ncbi:ATP-binding cassette sub-family A member 2-like [Physella acuta]|uniref:ATP-binding cassette sub-family A member 2-like n=1 Tax=Physella acuta TaxID=109671 RepID=UPI0027DD76BF|nr:ATP-binding cassette sub-family A member 2-like [Physella acuta]